MTPLGTYTLLLFRFRKYIYIWKYNMLEKSLISVSLSLGDRDLVSFHLCVEVGHKNFLGNSMILSRFG